MFARLCGYLWDIDGEPVPLIYLGNSDHGFPEIYGKNGISERLLKDLESIGLIQLTDGAYEGRLRSPASYYGRKLTLEYDPVFFISTGRVRLTKVGEELAPICSAKPVDGFFELMFDLWKAHRSMRISEVRENPLASEPIGKQS